MSLAELIEGCRRGDRAAQKEVYERYNERIYRLALKMTGNTETAFDVTQDTFVHAFQNITTFDGRADLGTWLYRIATNETLGLFRRKAVHQRYLRVMPAPTESTEPAEESRRHDVLEALGRLSDSDRTILELKYQRGLSYEEISAELKCPPGTVSSRLHRARARLREFLQQSQNPTEESVRLPHPNE